MIAALRSLWYEDGTKWAELFGGLGIFAWGFMHIVLPGSPGPHTFGVGMGWITREHLQWALLIAGLAQALMAVFGNRICRVFAAAPAFFLTLDIVLDVLFKGEFPPGAIAMFAVTSIMNVISIIRNVERRRIIQGMNYA